MKGRLVGKPGFVGEQGLRHVGLRAHVERLRAGSIGPDLATDQATADGGQLAENEVASPGL